MATLISQEHVRDVGDGVDRDTAFFHERLRNRFARHVLQVLQERIGVPDTNRSRSDDCLDIEFIFKIFSCFSAFIPVKRDGADCVCRALQVLNRSGAVGLAALIRHERGIEFFDFEQNRCVDVHSGQQTFQHRYIARVNPASDQVQLAVRLAFLAKY